MYHPKQNGDSLLADIQLTWFLPSGNRCAGLARAGLSVAHPPTYL